MFYYSNKEMFSIPNKSAGRQLSQQGLIVLVAIVAMLVVFGVVLCEYYGDVLYRVQELNLFLYTPLFFKQQLVVPGGLLSWLGVYFTQYFYHPWIGVSLLVLWWAAFAALSAKAFGVPARWCLVTLLPVALMLVANVSLGYWIYYLKLRGYFFIPTIGITAAVALVLVYVSLPKRWLLRTAFIIIAAIVGYPAFGAYGLFAVLLMAVMAWRSQGYSTRLRLADTVAALAAIAVVPVACYYTVYYQTNISYIYFAALPVFYQRGMLDNNYPAYVALGVAVLLLAVMSGSWKRLEGKPRLWLLVQFVVLLAVVAMVDKGWYKDNAFRIETRMNRCIGNQDWDGVLQAYRTLGDNEEATRMMWLYKNVALLRKGTILDEMYMYRDGAAKFNTPLVINMAQVGGKAVYLNFGQMNFCIRWCIEDGIEYGWKAEHYVYLAYCALANGEYAAAQKYIDILKQTKYYRDFALEYERCVGRPDLCRKDKMIGQAIRLKPAVDLMASDRSVIEDYLYHAFPPADNSDPLYQMLSMATALQYKDIPYFWHCFQYYAPTVGQGHMPSLVQQAAYLFGNLEHKVDISHMPFDKDIQPTFAAFMDKAKQCAGMSEKQMMPLFYPEYGATYYYDYFFFRQDAKEDKKTEQ